MIQYLGFLSRTACNFRVGISGRSSWIDGTAVGPGWGKHFLDMILYISRLAKRAMTLLGMEGYSILCLYIFDLEFITILHMIEN